jgi:predicted transcriptional regulator
VLCYVAHMTVQESSSTTLSVRLPAELRERLARLSELTRRTSSFLAAEAIADYVERELAIVEGIGEGIADLADRRVVSHDGAMKRLRATAGSRGRSSK